jgi:hypothetical protein
MPWSHNDNYDTHGYPDRPHHGRRVAATTFYEIDDCPGLLALLDLYSSKYQGKLDQAVLESLPDGDLAFVDRDYDRVCITYINKAPDRWDGKPWGGRQDDVKQLLRMSPEDKSVWLQSLREKTLIKL